MLPFDDTLHVHQARTVRSDNILGSGSHVIFYLITPHADGDCLFFHRKHSAKATTLVNMAGLEYFDAFYQIEQVTQFIVIRDVQFGGSGNQQFAHPMTAIMNTDFMRKVCRNFGRFQDIVNELTNIINLSRTLTNMSFFLQNARMILFR